MFKILTILGIMVSMLNAVDYNFNDAVKNGLEQINSGKLEDSMNTIRKAANCFQYENIKVDEGLEKTIDEAFKKESDKSKQACILIYKAVENICSQKFIPDNAIRALDDAEKLDSSIPEIFNTRGVIRSIKGDVEGAISDYSKAIYLNENYLDALQNRARAYKKIHKNELALQDQLKFQDLSNSLYYKKSAQQVDASEPAAPAR